MPANRRTMVIRVTVEDPPPAQGEVRLTMQGPDWLTAMIRQARAEGAQVPEDLTDSQQAELVAALEDISRQVEPIPRVVEVEVRDFDGSIRKLNLDPDHPACDVNADRDGTNFIILNTGVWGLCLSQDIF